MSPEGEQAKRLLKLANYARVAEVLGVSRASVARWAKGQQVTPWQLQRLQELLGHDEAAAPVWAAAMEERLTGELVRNRELIEALAPADIREAAARVIERLEALPPQGGEGQPETDGGEDQDAAEPPDPGPGSRQGRVVGRS